MANAMSWDQAMAAWRADLDRRSARDPRRIGWWLMMAGSAVLVAALPCSIALQNIGCAAIGAGAILARPPLHRLPGFWWGAAFAAWIGISLCWWALHPEPDVRRKLKPEGMSYTWLTGLLTLPAWMDPAWRRRLLALLAIVLASAALLTLVQIAVGQGGPGPFRILPGAERKGSGWYNEHLTHGFISALCALSLWIAGGGTRPAARWTGRVAATVAAFASLARSAWIGALVGAAAAWAARGWRHAAAAAVALAVAAGLALAGLAAVKPEKYRMLMAGEDGRWAIWNVAAAAIAEHPLVGAGGQDGYRAADRRLHPAVNPGVPAEFAKGAPHAHNSFLALAAERGIPAAILYLGLLASVVAAAWRLGGPARQLAVGLATCAVCAGMFERLAGDVESGFALFALLALALSLRPRPPAPPAS